MIVKKSLTPPPVHPQIQADRANDLPPPYITATRNTPSSSRAATTFHNRHEDAPDPNILSVNGIHINNRHEDVVGTYCIDPSIPIKRKIKSWKSFKGSNAMEPHASFRSRHGAISINLATSGTTADRTKAYIQAATRKGDIDINIYSLHKEKHIALDVQTRRGNIFVHIPRDFCGAIQLRSRKKGCKVLPALAGTSRILTVKDNEALILIGEPSSVSNAMQGTADDVSTDFCQLASRNGRVTVGYTGEIDNVPEANLWKKLGAYLWG